MPANRGVDRTKEVEKLQKKFKNQRGALPKEAEMPAVNMQEEDYDEERIKQRAAMRVEKKFKNFTQQVRQLLFSEVGTRPAAAGSPRGTQRDVRRNR